MDSKPMGLVELKVKAYDLAVMMNRMQQELVATERAIAEEIKKEQEAKKEEKSE